jgi:hypothetical protein
LRLVLRVDRREPVLVIALQEISGDVPARDLIVVHRQYGVVHVAADHQRRLAEVVVIVSVGAAERDNCRDGIAATSGTSSPLLVVGARRRHVA